MSVADAADTSRTAVVECPADPTGRKPPMLRDVAIVCAQLHGGEVLRRAASKDAEDL